MTTTTMYFLNRNIYRSQDTTYSSQQETMGTKVNQDQLYVLENPLPKDPVSKIRAEYIRTMYKGHEAVQKVIERIAAIDQPLPTVYNDLPTVARTLNSAIEFYIQTSSTEDFIRHYRDFAQFSTDLQTLIDHRNQRIDDSGWIAFLDVLLKILTLGLFSYKESLKAPNINRQIFLNYIDPVNYVFSNKLNYHVTAPIKTLSNFFTLSHDELLSEKPNLNTEQSGNDMTPVEFIQKWGQPALLDQVHKKTGELDPPLTNNIRIKSTSDASRGGLVENHIRLTKPERKDAYFFKDIDTMCNNGVFSEALVTFDLNCGGAEGRYEFALRKLPNNEWAIFSPREKIGCENNQGIFLRGSPMNICVMMDKAISQTNTAIQFLKTNPEECHVEIVPIKL